MAIGTWENYRPTFEVSVSILLIVAFGWICRAARLFGNEAVGVLNKFMFYVALPATVVKTLAVTSFDKLDWTYVIAFLILRFVAMVLCGLWTLFIGRGKITDFLTLWIATTWINTIIFGIPILKSLYPTSPIIFQLQPVLASLSSFFFQLPTMLLLYELHKRVISGSPVDTCDIWKLLIRLVKNYHPSQSDPQPQSQQPQSQTEIPSSKQPEIQLPQNPPVTDETTTTKTTPPALEPKSPPPQDTTIVIVEPATTEADAEVTSELSPFEKRAKTVIFIFLKILKGICANPPLISVLIGMTWSFTKQPIPSWLDQTMTFLGNTITPVSVFSIGIFMYIMLPVENVIKYLRTARTPEVKDIPYVLRFVLRMSKFIIYVTLKLVGLPLLMLPIIFLLGIKDASVLSALLLASMPVALSAFTLTKQYESGMDVMAFNVVVGTLCMLPALLLWQAIAYAISCFGTCNV